MNSWHSALTRGSIPPRSSLGRLKRPTTVMTEPPPLHSPHSLTPIESIERVRSERTTTTLKSPDEQKRRRRRRRQPSCLNVKLSSSRRDSASADDGRRGDGRNERYECEIERERERERKGRAAAVVFEPARAAAEPKSDESESGGRADLRDQDQEAQLRGGRPVRPSSLARLVARHRPRLASLSEAKKRSREAQKTEEKDGRGRRTRHCETGGRRLSNQD